MSTADIAKLVEYWERSSAGDLDLAQSLLRSKRCAYCLFFCHLAIEKMLKATVVARTRDHAPFSHNLPFLAGKAGLELDARMLDFLAEMTRWNLEARYPSDLAKLQRMATPKLTRSHVARTKELIRWLRGALKRSS